MLSVVEIEQLVRKKYEQNGRLDRLNHIWGVVKMALFWPSGIKSIRSKPK